MKPVAGTCSRAVERMVDSVSVNEEDGGPWSREWYERAGCRWRKNKRGRSDWQGGLSMAIGGVLVGVKVGR